MIALLWLWMAALNSVSATTGRPLQQPDETSLVIARQAAVARTRRRGRGLEAKQVLGRPAEHLGLLTPAGEEDAAVIDGELPAADRDQVRATGLKGREGATRAI